MDRPIEFDHDLAPTDFAMNDLVFNAFKSFVARNNDWKAFTPQLERNRPEEASRTLARGLAVL